MKLRAAKRLRVYVGEAEHHQGHPLYQVVVQTARKHGVAGATVTRAVEGFGPHSGLRTARIVDLAADLPMVVEIVDEAAKIDALLTDLRTMVKKGLMTVEDVEVVVPD